MFPLYYHLYSIDFFIKRQKSNPEYPANPLKFEVFYLLKNIYLQAIRHYTNPML